MPPVKQSKMNPMNAFLKSSLCAGVLCAAALASAAPLQRADIPSDPVWVLHLDCDGLRPTAVGQYLLEQMDQPEAKAKLAAFQTIFNIDLRKQVHGLTLYGTGKAPQDGVLLVYADVEPDRLITLAKAARDSQSSTYKQHTIYNWVDDKRKGAKGALPRVYAAVQGNHMIVFGQQETRVAQALDVLDRAAPNLAGSTAFAELGAAGNTSFLQAAARKMDVPDAAPNAALLRLATSARLEIGETNGELCATLGLQAQDEAVANQMASVGQGLLALIRLQKDNPGSVRLAESLSLKQDGVGVVASLAMPNADVIELMKAGAARKAQQKASSE